VSDGVFGRLIRFWGSPLGSVLKLVIGLGVLGYVVSTLDTAVLGKLARRASVPDLVAITLVALAGHVVGALRFKLLADPVSRLPLFEHARQYFVGAYFSMFLPSSMGGDGVRVLLLKNRGFPAPAAASLVFTERALGAISLVLVAAAAGAASTLPRELRILLGVAALGLVIGLLVASVLARQYSPKNELFRQAVEAARSALDRERLAPSLTMSIAYQVSVVAVTVVVNHALGLGVPTTVVLALSPLVWFATLLPISVGGLGVREAAFVLVFAWGGVDRENALLLSLGTYAGLVVVGLGGALWFTWDRVRGATGRAGSP
jgi:glycosyltransferase 2 family protein